MQNNPWTKLNQFRNIKRDKVDYLKITQIDNFESGNIGIPQKHESWEDELSRQVSRYKNPFAKQRWRSLTVGCITYASQDDS